MTTLLAKLFSDCTEKNKPLDDAIEAANLTPAFKDLYKKFLPELIKVDYSIQAETDIIKKDIKKALAFYIRCPGAFDLVNEILMGTEDKVVGLIIFFMRLVEGIKECQNKSLKPVFLTATEKVYSQFNPNSGDTFEWQGFAPCFDDIDKCLKRTKDGEKHVYFKINGSIRCGDTSTYGQDIRGVILPGATFKIENDETTPECRIITLSLTKSSNDVANALHPTKLKAVTGGPSLSVSNAAFQQSNLKNSPLENDFKTIKDGFFYEKLAESLKKIKMLPEKSGKPVTDAENEASVSDLMNRCKETIRYLNEQGTLKKYNLTEEEAMAITIFTFDYGAEEYEKNPQRIINRTLAERNTKSMMSIRGYILHLLSSLRKLPPYTESKTLYRGIDGASIKFDSYKVGEHRTWPAFTSTYPDEDSAMDFLSGDHQVLFEIRGDFHGYDIQDFSIFHEEEILLEPDTEFVIKEIKDNEDDGFKRIVVEVEKFDKLPVYREVEKFREEAEKKKLSMIPPGAAKKDLTPKVKKPEMDMIVTEAKRKIFEDVLCPAVAKKEEFDSLKPYNTIAFIRDILPKSSFSNWIHFCEYLSREILDRVAEFKKEITESGKVTRIDDEVKKFVKEYMDLINAVKERIKMASRVELRISFSKGKINNIESAKKYAKYAAQHLLKISNEGKTDYFMYNGAIKFRGFLNSVIWITMYARDGVNSADVAKWVNKQEIRYINSIVAEPFSLGYMNFFVTNSVIEYDVNRMLKMWFMEKYNICPEFVANYESKSRGVREFFVCCVTEQSRKSLESKTINFLAETRYFKEVIKAQVMSSDGDFFALPFDKEFYFTDIHSGENTIDVTLLNTSFYDYFSSVIKPRPCRILSCNQQQAVPTQPMNPPQMMSQQQQQQQQQYILQQQQQQQQYIQQPQCNQPYQNQTNIQIPPPSNQLYQSQVNIQIPPPSNQLYQSQANIQIPPPSNQQQQQQQQQQGSFIQMTPALNQQLQMQMQAQIEFFLNTFVQSLPDDQKVVFMNLSRKQQLDIVCQKLFSGQTQ